MSDDESTTPTCVICMCPALNPVRLSCECSVRACAGCLFKWINPNSGRRAGCPTCRRGNVSILIVDDISGETRPLALNDAAAAGDADLVNCMIAAGVQWWDPVSIGASGHQPFLCAAAAAGQRDVCKMIVEDWIGFATDHNDKKESAFYQAAQGNHLNVVTYFIEHAEAVRSISGVKDAEANEAFVLHMASMPCDGDRTPFMAAAAAGAVDVVRYLGDRGLGDFDLIPLEKKSGDDAAAALSLDGMGYTVAHLAARSGSIPVLSYILLGGGDGESSKAEGTSTNKKKRTIAPNALSADGDTVLQAALASRPAGGEAVVDAVAQWLLTTFGARCFITDDNGIATSSVNKTCAVAARVGQLAVAQRLLAEFGADGNFIDADESGECIALLAATSGVAAGRGGGGAEATAEFLDYLRTKCGVDLAAVTDDDGNNLLFSSSAAYLPVLKLLVEGCGMDPLVPSVAGDDGDDGGDLVLRLAVAAGQLDTVEYLEALMKERRGRGSPYAEEEAVYARVFGGPLANQTMLHAAVDSASLPMLRHVLAKVPSTYIDKCDADGNTPLMQLAASNPSTDEEIAGTLAVIKDLISAGADPSAMDSAKSSVVAALVMRARDRGAVDRLEALLFTNNKMTATVTNQLFSADAEGETPLSRACENVAARRAVAIAAYTARRGTKDPMPHSDIEDHALAVVRYILTNVTIPPECSTTVAAYITHRDMIGNTAIHIAAERGDVGLLKLLLGQMKRFNDGIDCLEKNSDGESPMHVAAERGHDRVARLLNAHTVTVAFGRTREGKSCAELAEENGFEDLAAFFKREDLTFTANDLAILDVDFSEFD